MSAAALKRPGIQITERGNAVDIVVVPAAVARPPKAPPAAAVDHSDEIEQLRAAVAFLLKEAVDWRTAKGQEAERLWKLLEER